MKLWIYFTVLFLSIGVFAEEAAKPVAAPAAVTAPVVAPVVETVQIVQSPAIEQPPSWLVKGLEMLYGVPVIGPIAAKIAQWIGVLCVILTSLVAFLMVTARALMTVMNLAGLVSFAAKLEAFQSGKIMYWLKYLSMFNAKKPEVKA